MRVKLKLKRKISGKKIRQAERQKRLKEEGRPNISSTYFKNKVHGQKRRDNPNLLTDDNPVGASIRNIRVPKKGRKTAWKRFEKNFPYITVTKSGGRKFNEQKLKEFHDKQRSKKEGK